MQSTITRLMICLCAAIGLTAQDPQEPPTPTEPSTPPAQGGPGPRGGGGAAAAAQEPRPYDRVITREAVTKKGVFTVHQIRERYYYEIPKTELNKEFLWVTQIAKTTLGAGYGGQALGNRVVRWERRGNRILLRSVNYDMVADASQPIAQAVRNANNDAILQSFPVAAWGPEEAAVIEVTRFFSSDVFEFSARQRLNASSMDASRSFIDRVSPYPENVEVETTVTYTRQAGPRGGGGGGAPVPGPLGAAGGMRPGSGTVVLHYSMVKLPEKPMMPRLYDDRVGYFSVRQLDYGREEHRSPQRRYITRWRLEKKDPNAAVSDPVKPIVYWIDSATPTKWIPYMKRGVEKWQKAFEAAGFRNAIIAKVAPTPEQDPDFSPEDARYSVIRWLPSTVENASGPHVHDPRTGEILDSDIQFHHNIMNLQRSWYFLQAGPLDPRAQKLPLPDDLMGELLEYVCAHEIGHTLGFQHNMKASSLYPPEKVRDKEWVKRMGHVPTLMDYSRFNYVAQPEDGIDPADLIPQIGPYDVWATTWGYKPIPSARTPDEEKPALDEMAREQDNTAWFRFSTSRSIGSDPGELTEAVGDADAVKSTALGIKNLERVARMLLPATTGPAVKGDPYDDLSELYGRMLGQWTRELSHVAAIVGGFDTRQKHVGQDGPLFDPIPKARQVEAVNFLQANAFATPAWAIDKEILRRIEPVGVLSRVRNAQSSVLSNLLSSPRFARLVEQSAVDGDAAYQPADFLTDVRKGVWKELDASRVVIDAYRRNLQRAYLDLANTKLNSSRAALPAGIPAAAAAALLSSSGDEGPMYRAELKTLNAAIGSALAKTADRATRAHLEGARDQIAKILDPKFGPPGGAGGAARGVGADVAEEAFAQEACWPDLMILP